MPNKDPIRQQALYRSRNYALSKMAERYPTEYADLKDEYLASVGQVAVDPDRVRRAPDEVAEDGRRVSAGYSRPPEGVLFTEPMRARFDRIIEHIEAMRLERRGYSIEAQDEVRRTERSLLAAMRFVLTNGQRVWPFGRTMGFQCALPGDVVATVDSREVLVVGSRFVHAEIVWEVRS